MSVYEMAKKYFPRLWDKSRIAALVEAGRLTEKEAEDILTETEKDDVMEQPDVEYTEDI